MKNLYFLVIIVLSSFCLPAQTIHGIWTGTLVNDSMHRTQNFELGLSEYRGKITGYTYTTFIDNDTFYYSVKRVRAERRDGKLVIEDEDMVGNNFPERASKKVKQTTTFPLINDSTIDIANGSWSTNRTKSYYSIGGSATVKEQEDEKKSDLLAHLEEMNVKADIAVKQKKSEPAITQNTTVAGPKREEVAKNNDTKKPGVKTDKVKLPPEKNQPEKEPGTSTVKNEAKVTTPKTEDKPVLVEQEVIRQEKTIAGPALQKDLNGQANNNKAPINGAQTNQPAPGTTASQQIAVPANSPQTNSNNSNKATASIDKPVVQKKIVDQKQANVQPVAQNSEKPGPQIKQPEKVASSVVTNTPEIPRKEEIRQVKELPSIVSNRASEILQDIYFKADSLVLSLYDNGIVDGDTVSVFVNGETVISRQMLKTSATKKTIYIPLATDSVQLVLFAENLGTIPPNTGLLTVRDGDEVYQVRFSADLQKNATIFLRRKK